MTTSTTTEHTGKTAEQSWLEWVWNIVPEWTQFVFGRTCTSPRFYALEGESDGRPADQIMTTAEEPWLRWEISELQRCPEFLREPSEEIIGEVAQQRLQQSGLLTATSGKLKATEFGGGLNNQVYALSIEDQELPYIMRVAKPVDPFYKTAAEVSTIAFIQQYTSIPVPSIIDFSTTTDNPIGLEWILMQPVAETAKSFLQELSKFRFPAIGGIYTKHIIAGERNKRGPIKTFDIPGCENFCIGPLVHSNFYTGRQLCYTRHRGPYKNEIEWVTGMVDMLIEAAHLEPLDDPNIEDEEERKKDAIVFQGKQLETLPKLRDLSQYLFSTKKYIHTNHPGPRFDNPAEDGFYLNPWDMNGGNLLIDSPDTPNVTTWIDWENVPTGPRWDISYPLWDRIVDAMGGVYDDDEETPEGQREDIPQEILMQIRAQIRPENKRKSHITGEDCLPIHQRRFLTDLEDLNLYVGCAEWFIKSMETWVGRRWLKDVQDPDDRQGRRLGSRCAKNLLHEGWL